VAERPNILIICTDQQRTDTLGCYGNRFVSTPNIDRLAREGAVFENAFVQSPICSPSRGSFLTGRYPRTTRLRQNGQIIPPDEKPISRLLADAGYLAGLVGKFHLAPGAPEIATTTEPRINDGFAEFNWAQSPSDQWGMNSDYTRFLTQKGLWYATSPNEKSSWVRKGMPEDATEAAWCATRASEFISRRSKQEAPWFYLANIYAPHHPFDPPESFLARYLDRLDEIPLPAAMDDDLAAKTHYQRIDSGGAYGQVEGFLGGFGRSQMRTVDHKMVKAAYWAMCDHVDQQVGRILQALDDSGEADNTIVVYMSDHGEMLGDHNIYLKGPYFYDAAIRIPLIIRFPARIAARRHPELFELVNLAPTLLQAAALEVYPGMQGRSAYDWLCDELLPARADDSIYCEYYNAMPYHRGPTAHLTMLRTATHKIVVDHAHDDGELYDLRDDPLEKRNLWRDFGSLARKAELLTKLTHRMAFTVDPLPPRLSEW
jgi:arylsulfatase